MKPRVLQVVLSLSPGGTERLVIELSRRLHAESGMAVALGAWSSTCFAAGAAVSPPAPAW